MLTTIIILITYIGSALYNRYYIQKCYYHPKGRWHNLKPQSEDVMIVFFPFMNIIVAFIFLLSSWKHEKYRSKIPEKFFKPKKSFK